MRVCFRCDGDLLWVWIVKVVFGIRMWIRGIENFVLKYYNKNVSDVEELL